ncbi:Fpg/Nei family DNA glycosylase [Microbulbifer yueqingensis]|uniref:Formamidopyrimidine-DNA glycosylase n=1 Tax=Microbulbifer yueqingensis TaxID=658219 RepID=A0A1G9AVS0_9GAMM|nr:DNA-formamidopyrimidine glycosylase family protein [Microbulbifer yueqingensis]SDK30675.1 formamidopyrimidine-DNA glycosylase [Microbulbifer yueqingensis]
MPELPDVERFRRYLEATALHQRIVHLHVPGPELLVDTSPQGLGRTLGGAEFSSATRHGKYLFALTDTGKCLVLHFGMTGELAYSGRERPLPDYTQLEIDFEGDNRLAYIAPRKLGRIAVVNSPDEWISSRELGPDALEISEEAFLEQSSRSRSKVKSWLMDQHRLAGIGNYYSDEILFQSHLHPCASMGDLRESERRVLYQNMRRVLQLAIDRDADPAALPRSFLLPHRIKGERCPRCGGTLQQLEVGGRTAYFCPACQPDVSAGGNG